MVLPEGTSSSSRPPRRGRAGVIFLAAVGVLVAGITLGSVTAPPEPEATEETTTSVTTGPLERPVDMEDFTIDQIAVGEPLKWIKVEAISGSYTHSIVELQGRIYLFGSARPWWEWDGHGLSGWRSDDGVEWESLGQAIDEPHQIVSVTSTPQGLVALEAGRGEEPARIWLSTDGLRWAESDLPRSDAGPNLSTWPMAVGASDRLMVVAVSDQVDVNSLFESRLAEITGVSLDLTRLGVGWDLIGDDVRFTVWGPLGFVLYEATGTELEITEAEREPLRSSLVYEGEHRVLSNWDDTGWQVGEIDASWIESITAVPDGAIVATGHGSYGPRTWRSFDGLRWDEVGPGRGPFQTTPWGDLLIGLSDSGRPEALVSEDGATWEETGLVDHFPRGLGWGASNLAAGPGGIALTVEAWLDSPTIFEHPEPPTLEREGHMFTIDVENGVIRLDEGDTSQVWGQQSDRIDTDLVERTLTLLHTETGDPVATFGFDELFEVEQSYWSGDLQGSYHVGLVFSPDAVSWIIQDAATAFGERARVTHLEVADDMVIAAVTTTNLFYPGAPGFEIWTAPIP